MFTTWKRRRDTVWFAACTFVAGSCGSTPKDGTPRIDSGAQTGEASVEPRGDGSPTAPDSMPDTAQPADAAACEGNGEGPITASCGRVELAIVKRGAVSEVRVRGNILASRNLLPGCLRPAQVELLSRGRFLVRYDGSLRGEGLLASGEAPRELTTLCEATPGQNRVEPLTVRITGTAGGRTFAAECGPRDGSGSWPPTVRATCHENIAAPSLDVLTLGVTRGNHAGVPYSTTEFTVNLPRVSSDDVHTLDSSILVTPIRALSSVVSAEPFTIEMTARHRPGDSSLTGPVHVLEFSTSAEVFPESVCPQPPAVPMPFALPPALLLRITGTGSGGAFTTEVWASQCSLAVLRPTS